MRQVLCYGSGINHALFALALKTFHKDTPLTVVRNPQLSWDHERSSHPGSLVITPPVLKALEELNIWESIKDQAAPVHHLHYRDSRSDEHFGSFALADLATDRAFRAAQPFSPGRKHLRELLPGGFWSVRVDWLTEALEEALQALGVQVTEAELHAITNAEAGSSSKVATVRSGAQTLTLPFDLLVMSQYHCPLPVAVRAGDLAQPTLKPLRRVPRSDLWPPSVNLDVVIAQPLHTDEGWVMFRNSPDCILELWDKQYGQVNITIKRVEGSTGPVAVRLTLKNQLSAMSESFLDKKGWAQVASVGNFVQREDFANEAFKTIWRDICDMMEKVRFHEGMRYKMKERRMATEGRRAEGLLPPPVSFLFADMHLTRTWVCNPASGDLPPYVVPLCGANSSFGHHNLDLGPNFAMAEAFHAAKYWTPTGLPVGFAAHQYAKAKTLARHLTKMSNFGHFRPWNLGKRMRIDFSHNGRLRGCLKQVSDWHFADRPLPKWRTAFLW
mmetsp:Transcript_148618/g.259744  ORF Transcript_148618/g.259744 Transcript_148618/m.259744 type:complete len:499 (-) Transcript_148618:11-1507(-)